MTITINDKQLIIDNLTDNEVKEIKEKYLLLICKMRNIIDWFEEKNKFVFKIRAYNDLGRSKLKERIIKILKGDSLC